MRALLIGAVVAAGVATAAQAQALDGPLSAPGEPPAAAAPAQAKTKPKPRKTHHAKTKPAEAPAAAQDAAVPSEPPPARAAAPADAVDLGMKWNGNNDGAAQTRFQSGPDTNPGAGAEVGMKLHF